MLLGMRCPLHHIFNMLHRLAVNFCIFIQSNHFIKLFLSIQIAFLWNFFNFTGIQFISPIFLVGFTPYFTHVLHDVFRFITVMFLFWNIPLIRIKLLSLLNGFGLEFYFLYLYLCLIHLCFAFMFNLFLFILAMCGGHL